MTRAVALRTLEALDLEFWRRVDKSGECWIWKGKHDQNGYGFIRNHVFPTRVAHRVAFLLVNGPIPAGLLVCHTCDNPPCVRPEHLWLGTAGDNNRDSYAKGRRSMAGERHPQAKLTEVQVREIRALVADGERLYLVARRFGVHAMTIAHIRDRKMWRHVVSTPTRHNSR